MDKITCVTCGNSFDPDHIVATTEDGEAVCEYCYEKYTDACHEEPAYED